MHAQGRKPQPPLAPSVSGVTGKTESLRVERPRLRHLVDAPDAAPISVLTGPAGGGKSELLRPFRDDPRAIYFRVGRAHGTFARIVHGFARTVAPLAPGAQASFPRAWERALQSRSPGSVLAHWLCEHLRDTAHTLAIDDLHDSAADPNIAAFIAKLDELRPNARLTIALRSTGALPVALWMATGRMDRTIGEADLRFNEHEVGGAAQLFGLAPRRAEIGEIFAAQRRRRLLIQRPEARARLPIAHRPGGFAVS